MRVLHLNAGNETGGGMHHILLLLNHLNREEFFLGVFEEGELSRRANDLGINITVFPQSSRLDISIINKIADFVKENDIEIIHTHGARANLFGTLLKRRTGCKWISTIHSDPRDDFLGQGLKGKIFSFLNIWSIKRADHLLVISDKFKEMVQNNFRINENKITTILNGIEFDLASNHPYSRDKFNLKEDDFVVIMVARLEKVKDHLTAFKAFQMALQRVPNIKLLLLGDGKEKENLRAEAERLGVDDHVLFLFHRSDVIDIYPLADLAILTSISESFPLVLLEAARQGIPAISTDVGGVAKMIPTSQQGWILDVGDYEGIAASLIEAVNLKEQDKLADMGRKFQEHCRSHFSIENQVKDIYDAYKRLVD